MTIEPTYQKLVQLVASYAQSSQQISIAGMHDAGKLFVYHILKQKLAPEKNIFVDLSAFPSSNHEAELAMRLDSASSAGPLVAFLNIGSGQVFSEKALNLLIQHKYSSSRPFSWAIFSNYPTYRQPGLIYQKMIRANFISIPPLQQEDLDILQSTYEKEIGATRDAEINAIGSLSGGNPGLYKSLWQLSIRDSLPITQKSALNDHSTLERLERICSELNTQDIATILKTDIHPTILARLKLFGYLDLQNQPFTPLLTQFLKRHVNQTNLHLTLTTSQKLLLNLLQEKKGQIVTRDEIAHVLWGDNWTERYSDWAIDTAISSLRRKLKGTKYHQLIQAKKGEGFFIPEP